jgi:hypothetical protein
MQVSIHDQHYTKLIKNLLTYLMTEQVDPAAADTPVGWESSQGYL